MLCTKKARQHACHFLLDLGYAGVYFRMNSKPAFLIALSVLAQGFETQQSELKRK